MAYWITVSHPLPCSDLRGLWGGGGGGFAWLFALYAVNLVISDRLLLLLIEDVSVVFYQVLSVCLALCPSALEALTKDKSWQCFIIDLLILCQSRYCT